MLLVARSPPLTFAAPAQAARDYVGLVNPWVEADIGRYFFFQSASSPFGFVKLRPDTSTHAVWGTGYRRNENEVKGFSHIHDWQFSGIQVMPTSGVLPLKTRGDTGWQSHVEHDDSRARAARLPPAAPRPLRHHRRADLDRPRRHPPLPLRAGRAGRDHRQPRRQARRGEHEGRARHARGQALDRGLGEPARRRLRLARHEAVLRHPRRPAVRLDARLGARQAARRAARRALRRPDGRVAALRPPAARARSCR